MVFGMWCCKYWQTGTNFSVEPTSPPGCNLNLELPLEDNVNFGDKWVVRRYRGNILRYS